MHTLALWKYTAMKYSLIALALLFPAAVTPTFAAEAARPNILWITCEDISPNLGCYGDRFARTPTLDALAARGFRFDNAFAGTGVCAVARSSIITGVWSSSLGSHHMRCTTRLPENVKCFTEYLRGAGYYCTNNAKTDYNFPVPKGAWDACGHEAHWRNRATGRPFFAVFNFTTTHESQIRLPNAAFFKRTARLTPAQRHDPAEVPLPPQHPDHPAVRQDWARYHDLITAMDYQVAGLLGQLEADGLADETIVFFYSDHGAGMPGHKKWVWDSGLHVPMIVYVPPALRHLAEFTPGSSTDRLVSFLDLAPTVLSLTGLPIPRHMQGSAFLGPKAAPARKYVFAIRDRMAERYDMVRVVRDERFQYHRNYMPHLSWSQRVGYTHQMPTMQVWLELARAGKLNAVQARYFLPTKPIEELYDVAADPHQTKDLAANGEYRGVLETMRRAHRQWQRNTHDVGLLPEHEIDVRSTGTTPYEMALDIEKHPQARLMEAADLANRMDPAGIGELLDLMKDPDAAVRYWGVIGLVALGEKAAPATDALLAALKDEAPNVRVAAADALGNLDRHEAALPVLIAELKNPSIPVRLEAINALDRLGPRARPALPVIRKMTGPAGHVGDYLGRMIQYVPSKFE